MKRQALRISIEDLQDLIFNLSRETTDLELVTGEDYRKKKWQINIINKTPKCSDSWEIE